MNDHDPFDDGRDPHLRDRMERAVGGLRAPDVVPQAVARGRRQRTQRRLAYGATAVAAATALVLAVPAVAGDWPGRADAPSTPPVATDPAATSAAPASPATRAPQDCDDAATGWWSKSADQIKGELAALLPAGIQIGETDQATVGLWGGNLRTGDDADFFRLTLLPPPGVLGPSRTLAEVSRLEPCRGGANAPSQKVLPCDELSGLVACEEIRSDGGALVGVVTERVERTVVNGQERPTDKSFLLATVAGLDGGHVELYVAEGTRADRPHTVHDPADVPALTAAQVLAIVSDPVWIG